MSNRHTSDHDSKKQAPEQHEFQFRGVLLPAGIVEAFIKDKSLTKADLSVLILVDALTRCGGEGCFASLAYFENSLHLSHKQVCRSIAKLKEMELLISYEGIRKGKIATFRETTWARAGECKTKHLSSIKNDTSASVKIDTQKDSTSVESNLKENCRSRDRAIPSFQLNGNSHLSQYQRAKRLHDFLAKHRKIMRHVKSLKAWASSFLELARTRTWDEIDAVLDWYMKHMGEEFVPVAYSAQAFVEKFSKIEDAINRTREDRKRKKNRGNPVVC